MAYLAVLHVSSVSGSVWDFRDRLLAHAISRVSVTRFLTVETSPLHSQSKSMSEMAWLRQSFPLVADAHG